MKKSKYGARKTTVDGITFHSKKEAARYGELKMLERAGEIRDLQLQPKFKICGSVKWNGRNLRERYYIADFAYLRGNEKIVEDVKGHRTSEYLLKRQLFLSKYGEFYTFLET